MRPQNLPESEHPYGWVMVAVGAIFIGMRTGGLTSMSVFLKPLIAEFGLLAAEPLPGRILRGACDDNVLRKWVVFTNYRSLPFNVVLSLRRFKTATTLFRLITILYAGIAFC